MSSTLNIACVIPARGGSKGIPNKNIMPFCDKPLIAWSIEQALGVKAIQNQVFVSSDADPILDISQQYGARSIKRPDHLSTDDASSESALQHALDHIEEQCGPLDLLVFLQATSPLRFSSDIATAISTCYDNHYDSVFSATALEDFFIWKKDHNKHYKSVNYDFKNRKRRQDIEEQVVENGSIYVFKPTLLRETNNRLGGNIGASLMAPWQVHEIDSLDDVNLCEYFGYTKLLNKEVSYD